MRKDVSSEVHCGECPFFKNEDVDGYGCCEISKMEKFCGDLCYFITNCMHVQETLRLLHYCQKWRRGANVKMPPPTLFGLAIDNAMRIIRNLKKKTTMKPSKALINRMRQDLMSKTSDAEKAAIRNCELLGYKVVRQQPITTGRKLYFADIYLPDLKTIIEIDGDYHYTKSQRRKDNNRSSGIWRMGYHVVRLNNHDARNIKKIKAKIELIKNKFNEK